ncbi:MAG: hemolysin family protein [Treponema sp.]|jgi:putative hemolysin|nr:hemolysin family protein [Treponema sp.]
MEDPLPGILFILAVILVKGFFSLIETAIISSRKTWLRVKAEEGDKQYRKVLEAVEAPLLLLSALRIGIIFLGILAGVAGGCALVRPLGTWFTSLLTAWDRPVPGEGFLAAALVTVAITLTMVILGDTLPKGIALVAPERIIVATLPLVKTLAVLCTPLIFIAAQVSTLILKLFRLDKVASPLMTEDELHFALEAGEKSGIVESKELTMVEGVFYLGDRPVGAFMTHRSEIQWLDLSAETEAVRAAATEYRDQRYFPVADGALDAVAGVVSVQDILLALLAGPWPGLKVIMKVPYFIPETMSALNAFEAFKKGDTDFLLVMDEYGGFAGGLSVRDLIEEITGRLSAPTQDGEAILHQDDGTYLVDGSINIDEIAKVLSLASLVGEHQEYHTLAGFILSLAGEIPRTGARFDHKGYRFTIVDMDGNRIDKVLVAPIVPLDS